MPAWESLFATLFCDHLTAANEGSTGIPAAGTLLKRTQDEGLATLEHPRPRLVVSCALQEPPHPRMLVAVVSIDLLTVVGEGGTPPATAMAWMQSIRDYLADDDAWRAFILSLDESRRTGWRILRKRLAGPELSDDRESRTRDYRQPVHLRVAV